MRSSFVPLRRTRDLLISRSAVRRYSLVGSSAAPMTHDTGHRLSIIQGRFHELIRERAGSFGLSIDCELPVLQQPLPQRGEPAWFPVPGMAGGFSFWADEYGPSLRLVTESWSRLVGGSGQRHQVDPEGICLLDEGFV